MVRYCENGKHVKVFHKARSATTYDSFFYSKPPVDVEITGSGGGGSPPEFYEFGGYTFRWYEFSYTIGGRGGVTRTPESYPGAEDSVPYDEFYPDFTQYVGGSYFLNTIPVTLRARTDGRDNYLDIIAEELAIEYDYENDPPNPPKITIKPYSGWIMSHAAYWDGVEGRYPMTLTGTAIPGGRKEGNRITILKDGVELFSRQYQEEIDYYVNCGDDCSPGEAKIWINRSSNKFMCCKCCQK